jgi:hypothetical protein
VKRERGTELYHYSFTQCVKAPESSSSGGPLCPTLEAEALNPVLKGVDKVFTKANHTF